MIKKKYIVGMGNFAKGDDGIGLYVIDHIQDQGLDQGFTVVEAANDGMLLLTLFTEETDRIVVVDCAYMGKEPGDFIIVAPEELVSHKQVNPLTSHEGDVLQLIELGRKLGLPMPEIRILAIEPVSTEMTAELSELLSRKLGTYSRESIEALA